MNVVNLFDKSRGTEEKIDKRVSSDTATRTTQSWLKSRIETSEMEESYFENPRVILELEIDAKLGHDSAEFRLEKFCCDCQYLDIMLIKAFLPEPINSERS